jgi:putative membrane protein
MNDSKRPLIETLVIFLKGLFMGGADIIPGVSGGTIALITGIYERFVNALRSIDLKFVAYFFYGIKDRRYLGKARENFASIDFRFLLPLAAGVLVAFLALANVIGMLMDDFPAYTYAFFLGLILCSALVIYLGNRKEIRGQDLVMGAVGLIVGVVIVGLQGVQADHSLLIILLAGMITFCAMILPGISGAFILLILGQYEFMLGVLRQLSQLDFSQVWYAVTYVIGGIIGLIVFSRALSYLLRRHHGATLMFVVGLMIGALRQPIELISDQPGDLMITIIVGAVGAVLVFLLYHLSSTRTGGEFPL